MNQENNIQKSIRLTDQANKLLFTAFVAGLIGFIILNIAVQSI